MSNHNPPTNGFDKRPHQINRKGRPKSFDALRALGQQIAHETAVTKDGTPLTVNGKPVTVTEAILRKWATSQDTRLQMAFIEIAYGKVPQAVELGGLGGGPVEIHVSYDDIPDSPPTTPAP